MSGYVAQITLLEILPMASWLKEMLLAGAHKAEIQQKAVENGFNLVREKKEENSFFQDKHR